MATWTNLDASVDAGDPITTTLMQGLKDNPVAIAEGAANAPQITTDGALRARATSGSHTGGFMIALLQVRGTIAEVHLDSSTDSNVYAPHYRVGRGGTYLVQIGVNVDSANSNPSMTWNVQVDTGSGHAIDTDLQLTGITEGSGFVTANKLLTLSAGDRVRLNGLYTSGSNVDRQDIDARVALYVDNPIEFGGYMLQNKITASYSSGPGSSGQTRSETTELVDNGGVQTGLFTIPLP